MREIEWSARLAAAATLALAAACNSTSGGADVPDAGATLEAGADAASACDSTLANAACWTTFVSEGLTQNTSDFAGAAFDGRAILFVNAAGGPEGFTVQYPIEAPFTAFSSWSVFNTQVLGPMDFGFSAAAFDGRYMYIAPHLHAEVARYDTTESLTAKASWSTLPLPGAEADASAPAGFSGAVFDGRAIEFVPGSGAQAVRYDTGSAFDAGSSWSSFDVATLAGGRGGFAGAGFDGRFVYYVPHADGAGPHGVVARYDSRADFTAAPSWSVFDASTVNGSAIGFSGAAFDGRFVYFVPNAPPGTARCVVARYDTQAAFGAAASWSAFDTGSLGPQATAWSYDGAAFDGRYVTFAPAAAGAPVLRYDTQAAFAASGAWAAFDLTANISGFHGAVFDGRYVYLVPAGYSRVARFDTVGNLR